MSDPTQDNAAIDAANEQPLSPPNPDAAPVEESDPQQGDTAGLLSAFLAQAQLQIDESLSIMRTDLTKYVDDAFDAISEKLDGIDLEELRALAEAAKTSSTAALEERLNTVEQKMKHFF